MSLGRLPAARVGNSKVVQVIIDRLIVLMKAWVSPRTTLTTWDCIPDDNWFHRKLANFKLTEWPNVVIVKTNSEYTYSHLPKGRSMNIILQVGFGMYEYGHLNDDQDLYVQYEFEEELDDLLREHNRLGLEGSTDFKINKIEVVSSNTEIGPTEDGVVSILSCNVRVNLFRCYL